MSDFLLLLVLQTIYLWGSEALSSLEHLSQLEPDVITYIVAGLPYSFQTQYIFQPDLLHMRCWDEHFMVHDYICGLLNSPMSRLSLRTLRFEDRCSHLCYFRAVVDAQCYINTFSLDIWCFRWIIFMDMTQYFIWCCGYYFSYIDSWDIYWLVVSWSGGHMDLVVYYTMYWCPYSGFEVLDLYSLVLPSLERIEVVIPTIVLAF